MYRENTIDHIDVSHIFVYVYMYIFMLCMNRQQQNHWPTESVNGNAGNPSALYNAHCGQIKAAV